MAYNQDEIGNRVKVGMVKNMAFEMMKASGVTDLEVFEEGYKRWARFFARVNEEIDAEHLPALSAASAAAAPVSGSYAAAARASGYAAGSGGGTKVPCPKCGETIPAGFKFHAVCGWSQGK